jgi:adenylate cyclase
MLPRLEALAEPGGICVSGVVRDQIRGKLPYPLGDRGEQTVKNIALPVRVYALRPEAIADLPATNVPIAAPRLRRTVPAAVAAGVAAMLVIAAGAWWWLKPVTKPSAPPAVVAATPVSPPLVAPRLSIVVLPFANLSNDPNQQYFADGITDDLTTDLSRIGHSFVISRNTAFTYRNKPVDTKQIGREVGVRYVLEGSVRRSGSKVRVNAQLIDAETDAHLWAEQFDGDMADLFAMENEITGRIANALNVELTVAEAARPTEHPDAMDYFFRGNAAVWKPPSRDNYVEIFDQLERAVALDPRFVDAQSSLAIMLAARVGDNMSDTPTADIARAEALAGEALAAAPRSWLAHHAKGLVLRRQERCTEAIPEFEAVLASNRNFVYALSHLGQCKLITGLIEESIPLQEQAIRLSPRDPYIYSFYANIGLVHLLRSRTDEAIVWFEKARNANSRVPLVHARLASAYALKGESERAAAEIAEARRLGRDDRYSSIARVKAVVDFGVPKVRALFEATYFEGLRKAGVPEE